MNVTPADTSPTSDLAAILQRLQTLETTVVSLRETITTLEETVTKQDALIRQYQAMLFGKQSEKGTPDAASPPAEAAPPPADSAPPPAPTPKRPRGQRHGAPGHGRRLYEELPPREELHVLPDADCRCSTCGEPYAPAGTEDATTIAGEVTIQTGHPPAAEIPADLCLPRPTGPDCAGPAEIHPEGLAGDQRHRASRRQQIPPRAPHQPAAPRTRPVLRRALRPRHALRRAEHSRDAALRPLYDATLLHLRAADHWHADETRWLQFGDETKHRWWLWVFASADAVAFVLDPSRARAVPRRVFGLDTEAAATGIVSCDRWKSYQGLDGLACAYCWAHARRDFTDLAKGYPATLGAWADAWGQQRIGTLYHLTDQRQGVEPGTDAFRLADLALRDHVEAMAQVRDTERADTMLLRAARDALDSLGRHWNGLTLFLDHPWVPLDNNEAERLLRTGVVGRKNFYGSGSGSSGQLAECAYTVLLTAARNGLNPLTYLRAYLDACALNGGTALADLARFLPWTASAEDLTAWQRPPTAA